MPRYLRFARALALAGAASAEVTGCYLAHERPNDANVPDAGPPDAYVPDVPDAGLCARPLPCTCPTFTSDGTCTGAYAACCPVVGPLAPPDLPIVSGSW